MQLRRTSGRACVRVGLAALVLALAASPAALGVAEKPKPDALWKAFPLEPADKRPASPLLPPAQERVEGRVEATTITDARSEASGPDLVVLALVTLLLLLACVVALSGRRLYIRRHHRGTVPLWQGVTWPHAADNVRPLHPSRIGTGSALVGAERRAAEPHPDVLAPRYRWADRTSARRSRPSLRAEIGNLIDRMQRKVWMEDSAAALLGAAIAGVAALVFFYLVG